MPDISTFPLPKTHWALDGRMTFERLWNENVEHGKKAL